MEMLRVGRRLPLALGAVVACVAAVGCGKSAPTGPPTVHLSLTAPVDGARVDVRNLLVLGTVDPQTAIVKVAGTRVHVSSGTFRRWVSLRSGVTHIGVSAVAPGFIGSALSVSVHSGRRRIPIPHSPPTPLQEFLNRANQACSRGVDQLLGFDFAHIDRGVTSQVAIQRAHRASQVGAQVLRQLRAIHAPAKQAAAYAAFLADFNTFVGAIGRAANAGGTGQAGAAITLINGADPTLSKLASEAEGLELFLCFGGLGA
jgi:hypothetical protein